MKSDLRANFFNKIMDLLKTWTRTPLKRHDTSKLPTMCSVCFSIMKRLFTIHLVLQNFVLFLKFYYPVSGDEYLYNMTAILHCNLSLLYNCLYVYITKVWNSSLSMLRLGPGCRKQVHTVFGFEVLKMY